MDELTQVLNIRGIEKRFDTVFSNEDSVLGTILLMDIDHFKGYNDTYGHLQGDVCLKELSHALKLLMPPDAFLGRYGGEEFLCFVPLDTRDMSFEFAETLRMTAENLGDVTISVGGYVGLLTASTIDQSINQADMALYRAKEKGRNQVVFQEVNQ